VSCGDVPVGSDSNRQDVHVEAPELLHADPSSVGNDPPCLRCSSLVTPTRTAPRWGYPVLLALLALCLGVSGAPAPLYALYAKEFGFAPITTTVVFAVYGAAALVSVLVTGAISDRFGRRPVLGVALGLILVGLVVFMTAGGVAALIVARVLHGLGVGTVIVVASAALLDLRPHDGARTGKHSGIALNVGIMFAIFGTAVDAEYGASPLVTPYAVLAVLIGVGAVLVVLMPETHLVGRSTALQVARPRVPADIALDFRFAAIGVMASWSVLGVFLSLFPTIAGDAVGTDNLVYGGGVVALTSGAAAISQQAASWTTSRTAAIVGDLGTAVFLVASIAAVAWGNGWFLAAVSALLGFFFGLAFGSSLRHLGQVVPAAHRGEVMSAFYVLAYAALALPTVLAGWAATVWSAESIFAPFMVLVALACVTAGVLGLKVPVAAPGADTAPDVGLLPA
jgi:MFS family permease